MSTSKLLGDHAKRGSPASSLLIEVESVSEASSLSGGRIHSRHYDTFDDVPTEKRKIGLVSAIFIIFNRLVGTGIFATPSSILVASGSVGLAMIMWVMGALIATAGLAVYVEYGTGLPKSGGELTYLSYVFIKPRYLVVACYAAYAAIMPWPAGNSTVFGEYVLRAAGRQPTRWSQGGAAVGCITFAFVIHSFYLKWGLRLQNTLGIIKFFILLLIAISGFAALAGHVKLPEDQKPHNFDNIFEGTNTSPNALVTGLYNVIWSFIGYSNINYSLSEVRNPVRTLKIAGPTAMAAVTVAYIAVNTAYFAAVSKEDMMNSGRTVAAMYFRNMFGPSAERTLSLFVALSALGNVLSVLFALGRVNQEMGRMGILPPSRFWSSNKPRDAPAAGLFLQWSVCVILIVAAPPGDAFSLVLNLVSYPLAIINAFISAGLLFLYTPLAKSAGFEWAPPFRASWPVVLFFFLSNVFLTIAPLVPPLPGLNPYKSLPYWLHVALALGVFAIGGAYWVFWVHVLPRFGRYRLERVLEVQDDGIQRSVFKKVPL
ncbi:high affinity methionine permease [Gloeopeniophorella convolvens]|nr:high affinity methionine permease [Gloeopeniophorella convolvens]